MWCELNCDFSQPTWDAAPIWQKESALAGAQAIADGKVTSPEGSHEGWMRHKEADGWVYGDVKDPEKKTHPCMVPYDQLPPEQRVKDTFFWGAVRSVLGLDK